ncbi:MAG TPA: hypothetical protein ENJ19_08800 [Gammaproteobacteria bacterium]|nr:hypothetical protein [Gammaproteobacteria bacterium]
MTTEFGAATELPWLWAGLLAYCIATLQAFRGVLRMRGPGVGAALTRGYEWQVLAFIVLGVLLLTVALAERWMRLGHGPFVNLFELLMSQLFSLGLIYAYVYWRHPPMRASAIIALPLMWILGVWVLLLEPVAVPFPPTYHNSWLWAHVGFGKVFLSFSLVGTGLAGIILLRGWPRAERALRHLPPDALIENLAWRFMLLAFIFHSFMLIAGAVWAQDAWGRYWSWDALETSSFLTWLALGGAIHARLAYRVPRRAGAVFIVLIFIVAFLTYFGTPFYSEAAHKGVI